MGQHVNAKIGAVNDDIDDGEPRKNCIERSGLERKDANDQKLI